MESLNSSKKYFTLIFQIAARQQNAYKKADWIVLYSCYFVIGKYKLVVDYSSHDVPVFCRRACTFWEHAVYVVGLWQCLSGVFAVTMSCL